MLYKAMAQGFAGWMLAILMAWPAGAVSIVAAESAYGDLARQVAGPGVAVVSLLTNPGADPHVYEPAPSAARAVAQADIVVVNGGGYDAWAETLLRPGTSALNVAALLHRRAGDNPHFWYDPLAAPALVRALAARLAHIDTGHAGDYGMRCAGVLTSLSALQDRVAALRLRFAGRKVAATEPVFALMMQAIGLSDDHARFELAVMNGAEPRASDLAALQDDLRQRRVAVLIRNAQASSPAAARLAHIAREAGVAVVEVSETLPQGQSYQAWVAAALDRLQAALAAAP